MSVLLFLLFEQWTSQLFFLQLLTHSVSFELSDFLFTFLFTSLDWLSPPPLDPTPHPPQSTSKWTISQPKDWEREQINKQIRYESNAYCVTIYWSDNTFLRLLAMPSTFCVCARFESKRKPKWIALTEIVFRLYCINMHWDDHPIARPMYQSLHRHWIRVRERERERKARAIPYKRSTEIVMLNAYKFTWIMHAKISIQW